MRQILIFLLLAMSWVRVQAAWPNDDAFFIPVADGGEISGGIVTALVQGRDGLIWIGTQQGLVRYDGYTFERFVPGINDPNALAARVRQFTP